MNKNEGCNDMLLFYALRLEEGNPSVVGNARGCEETKDWIISVQRMGG